MQMRKKILFLFVLAMPMQLSAADKLIGIHSARVLSQSMPWVAQEAGLFKKYNLDFDLVFIVPRLRLQPPCWAVTRKFPWAEAKGRSARTSRELLISCLWVDSKTC